jgi:pantetheine-phosphate adenylyltransferase
MQQSLVFPGSFDPFTNGHTDIVERAALLFPKVVIGVLENPTKECLFTLDERVAIIRETFRGFDNVEVMSFTGLLVDFVRKVGASLVLRGLRMVSDYEFETQMALMNRHLAPEIETIFMMAREESSYVSSSVVKQIALLRGNVEGLVPDSALKALKLKYEKYSNERS